MSDFDELSEKFHQLQSRLVSLEESVKSGNYPGDLKGAVPVSGSLELPKINRIKISEFSLVEAYNNVPQLVASNAVKVSLTADSFRQKTLGEIFMEKAERGNYWVIATEDDTDWLLPNGNIRINKANMRAIKLLFKCNGDSGSDASEFTLSKPARVSLMPNGQMWKLEELGVLEFGNTSGSPKLPSELERATEGREQSRSELSQLEIIRDEFQKQMQSAVEERKQVLSKIIQMQSKIEQMSQISEQFNARFSSLETRLEAIEQNLKVSSQANSSDSKLAVIKNVELLHTLTGHTETVKSIAIGSWQERSNKQFLASSSFDKTIKIWNLNTGELIGTLTGQSKVSPIAFGWDGQTLISGDDANNLRIVNLVTDAPAGILTGHSDLISSIAISLDGQILASGSRDETINVWNLQTRELIHTLTGHDGMVLAIAISPDGKILASGGADNTIKLWNLHTGRMILTLFGHSDLVCSVAISPDGQTLASGSRDNTIKLWHLKTAQLQRTFTGHSGGVWAIAISPDGQTLVSGGGDRTIKLWNLKTGELQHTLTGHTNEVYCIAISRSEELSDRLSLVSGSKDQTIKIWKLSS